MPTADIAGLPIHYEDSGGDGPAVLFSHGFFMDHTMFDPQVEALAPDYRCIRWDQRGFGATPAPLPFTYWDSAEDAVELLDHLGIDRAVLVGMSQGGFLSLRAALANPERVRALVLIDSAADVDGPEEVAGYEAMFGVLRNGTAEERGAVLEAVAGMLIGDDELARHWIPRWAALDADQLGNAAGALLERDDVSDRLGEIGCPSLVIHGSADQAIVVGRAEAAVSGLADCRGLVRVDGAAHAPNLTHPGVVNPVLRAFLDSLGD
jgi:3-oxoadipate enol-lactonase